VRKPFIAIIPFLYRWLTYKKGIKRIMPITARNIINSGWSFFAFLVGSLFHSVIGFFLFKLTRPTDSKKLFFHKCLAFAAGFVVKRLPDVKTRVLNRNGENFLKPSVIICNHQSHIDLVLIMMLSPRIVILTNEWVWNSPFYGSIVKNADFYPVVNGLEGGIEHLSRLIDKGYSIMIFPEGTRSEDCNINRFHRGAFFLAEQLKLDILPIVLHGIGHVLPKTDFLLRRGEVTVEIMDRISPENLIYGDSYLARAKNVRSMYRNHYQKLISEIETPGYYADKLLHNYIYKGSAVSAQVRSDMKKHNNYSEIISHLPDSGRVLVLGSGNGSFSLLLSMVKPSMHIDAVESDEDRVDLARNCASCTDKITYIHDNPLQYNIMDKYEAIILVDYFSLLKIDEQQLLLKNCKSHTFLILISDIKYSWINKISLKIAGVELPNVRNHTQQSIDKMSEELFFDVSQKENIFALSLKG
jgi:1-acyl-sn-glycerol-3-phosphate acyltransferase